MSERNERVASLLQELIATFIRQEANTDPLITVTGISLSPDYRYATVLVTTIPDDREEDALIFLQRLGGELRHYVKRQSNLKIIPQLSFAIDYGERHRQRMDSVVRNLDEDS